MRYLAFSNARDGKLLLRTSFIFTIILVLAVGATWWLTRNHYDTSEATNRAFLRLDSSLVNAAKTLTNACLEDSAYVDLKARTPGYEKILIIYKPKIDSVLFCARRMQDYIQSIKHSLHSNIDLLKDENVANSFQEGETPNWNNEASKSLYDSLTLYSKLLLKILPSKMQQFSISTPVDNAKSFSKNALIWQATYFDELTLTAILASLTELEYKVWLSANQMTNIIRSQWTDHLVIDESYFYFLTSINSSHFLPGQTLEISAGLGAYVTNINPQIFINSQKQTVSAEGYAIYKQTITESKGGSIPIVVSYNDPNTGELRTMSKWITYTVFQQTQK